MSEQDDELLMLRDTAVRLVREATAGGIPAARDMGDVAWQKAVESGWTALLVSEQDGGLGGSAAAICALAEELGSGLQLGSLLLNDALAAQWLAAVPAGAARTRLIEGILSGERRLAVADIEPGQRGAPGAVGLRARRVADTWVLNGAKSCVWVGSASSELLVSAATEAEPQELLLLAVARADVQSGAAYASIDGGMVLDCRFLQLTVPQESVLAGPGDGFASARVQAWDLVLLATAAESLGMMRALIRRTAEYLSERKQFGQPLAKFQVLRHRMADMALASFRAQALIQHVAAQFAALQPAPRAALVAATCNKAMQGARFVAEQSVQLHGGMGVSAEVPVGKYLKRLLALEATVGGADFHRGRFADRGSGVT
jgi:alkylation response protein AidB-like acyl-CoA dehydrogenase